MRRFFTSTSIICLTGSFLLHYYFHYSTGILLYHLLIMAVLHVLVFIGNILLALIRPRNWRKLLLGILNFTFLAGLIIFYITILGSNAFWGKAISASLFFSYLASFDEFISILPVQKWIFYATILLLFILITGLYRLIRPRGDKLHIKYVSLLQNRRLRVRIAIGAVLFLLAGILFYKQLLYAKRNLHFAGEPVLEFAYGQMWDSHSMESVYDSTRVKNGLRDKACIDSLTAEKEKKTDRVVVVILIDALRRDFLPAYGYERSTTPFLDSLQSAGKMIAVDNVFSTSTTTLLGVGGLFSSKDWETFSYTGLNIMKYLKKKGFSTYAFLTGQHRSWYGLSSIYKNDCDFFYESTTSPTQQNFDDLTTLQKFRDTKIDKSSFVYLHLLSTHSIGKKREPFRRFLPDKIGIGTDKKTALVNNYDNGVLQADYVIREVFKKLELDGQLAQSSVYIVADHGELFGEDGRWSHSGSIHQTTLSIPLLIYDQDLSWYTNREAGTIKDVAPTIADRLGYTLPGCWEGVSLHQPVHDFSMKVNSGMECDYPQGTLSFKDSSFRLEIMDANKEIKKILTTRGGKQPWKVIQSN